MDTPIVDIVLRVNRFPGEIEALEQALRAREGVVSVHLHGPKMMLIGFNPDRISSEEILQALHSQGAEAEWVVPDRL